MYLGKIVSGEMKEILLQFREIHVYSKMLEKSMAILRC